MFRVEWLQGALDDLASLWTNAGPQSRQAITAAANAIDQTLRADPFVQSESREDDERVMFLYPLGILIEVDLTKRIVWVLHTWRFGQSE